MESGGMEFKMVPALNDDVAFTKVLKGLVLNQDTVVVSDSANKREFI